MTIETCNSEDCKDGGSLYPSEQLYKSVNTKDKKYKSIYKCRLCGEEFKSEAFVFNCASDFPTAPILKQHKCKDGRYGCGDFCGTYEVEQ